MEHQSLQRHQTPRKVRHVECACEARGSWSSADDPTVAAVAGGGGEASYAAARRSTRTVDCSSGVAGEAPLLGPVAVAAAKLTMGVCGSISAVCALARCL